MKKEVKQFLDNPTPAQYRVNKKCIMRELNSRTDAEKFYYLHRIGRNPNNGCMLVSAAVNNYQNVFDLVRDGSVIPEKHLKGNKLSYFKYKFNGEGDPLVILSNSKKEDIYYTSLLKDIVDKYKTEENDIESDIEVNNITLDKDVILDLIASAGKEDCVSLIKKLIKQYSI